MMIDNVNSSGHAGDYDEFNYYGCHNDDYDNADNYVDDKDDAAAAAAVAAADYDDDDNDGDVTYHVLRTAR